MIKIKENKTRKRLRITQCVLYLFQIVFCSTFNFVRVVDPETGNVAFRTVFGMLGYMMSDFSDVVLGAEFASVLPVFFIFPIVPIVGFFFCALDKERNMKNIASLICCLVGVFTITNFLGINMLTYGSVFALINYILISFITAIAMMARLTKDAEARPN